MEIQILVLLTITVEDLYFVLPLEIDAGVAALGHVELDVQLAVAMYFFGEQVDAAVFVHKYAVAFAAGFGSFVGSVSGSGLARSSTTRGSP